MSVCQHILQYTKQSPTYSTWSWHSLEQEKNLLINLIFIISKLFSTEVLKEAKKKLGKLSKNSSFNFDVSFWSTSRLNNRIMVFNPDDEQKFTIRN